MQPAAPRTETAGTGRRPASDRARTRMLAAAHDLFTDKGYRATTTKEISQRAQVAEPTIFRHFGSKAELFEATVLEPFTAFIQSWTQSWRDFPASASVEDLAEQLVEGLFTLVRQNRRLFQELITARSDPASDLHGSAVTISDQLREGLRAVHDEGLDIAGARGLHGLDPPATIGVLASMVLGTALLEDWVYPSGTRTPGQERIVREMTSMIYYGIAHRPR